ncbi:hypothetical protein M569_07981 [Genlisea aurea]|uniref:Uncharacterized protein n=1 Tax=Genlisea aurea TaxID=192259 RepID=S8CPL1_9LAMI|nr:hypothetical protein M569_07981 [Genlisea aurea]
MSVISRRWVVVAVVVAAVALPRNMLSGWSESKGGSRLMLWLRDTTDRLGYWAIPAYIGLHTVSLALCLPYAVFFEAGASMLFGFLPALFCVFSAKVLGASMSFWIGRSFFFPTHFDCGIA